jgi:hypothetical protein
MRIKYLTFFAFALASQAMADGFSWNVDLGMASPHFSKTSENVWMNTYLQNQYTVSKPLQRNPLLGLGGAYQWDVKKLTLSLGASIYTMQTSVSGVNSPFINAGYFDTVNYSASGESYAAMLEPKLILNASAWQPYVLAGAGVSLNHFYSYAETSSDPESSASPTQTPFAGRSAANFAYEGGVGIQHALTGGLNAPSLALDYRYMNWGRAGLSAAPRQTVGNGLNFGRLTTSSVNLRLVWPL